MPKRLVDNLLYEDLTYKVRGAVFKVYNTLGFGHRDKVGSYTPDFLIDDKIIIEIKSIYRLELLVNFGTGKLEIKRKIWG